MGSTVVWMAPIKAEGFQGTARAIRYGSGKVLFELSTREDALGVPQWDALEEIPEQFLTCAAAIMAGSVEDHAVTLTPEELKPLEHHGEWRRKKRQPGVLHRLAISLGVL